VERSDPASFAAGAGLLVLAAAAASYLPGRRAARVDPALSIRAE
jgi:ABC-type lipoprotein release transport system permease subunit